MFSGIYFYEGLGLAVGGAVTFGVGGAVTASTLGAPVGVPIMVVGGAIGVYGAYDLATSIEIDNKAIEAANMYCNCDALIE